MRPIATVGAAALVSALLLWSSQPPLDLGVLAWCALVPVAVAALRAPTARSARAAVPLAYVIFLELLLVPALPFGIAKDQWGDTALPVLVGDSPVLVVALIAMPLFGLLLYAIRFPRPWPPERREPPLGPASAFAWIAVPALTWTALDFARVKVDPGAFWGPLFISQSDGPAAALGALAGPWLVTFAIVAVNYALVLVVTRGRNALAPAAAVAAAVVALVVLSPSAETAAGGVRVAAVQPGHDTAEFEQGRWGRVVLRHFAPGTYDLAALDMVRELAPLTRQAARRGAELIVWPEAALWVDPRTDASVRRALSRLARDSAASIVVPFFEPGPDHSATVIVDSDGRYTATQPKQRPMWYLGERDDNRGTPRPVATAAGLVGTTLGVDNQEPRPARELARRGADVVASSTHDWKQLATPQRALASLHATESGVPIVRADWRYGSAVFAAGGDEVADAGGDRRRTIVVADVRPRAGSTPYTDIGDAGGWVALALGIGLTVAGVARGRASRARAAAPARRPPVPSSPA